MHIFSVSISHMKNTFTPEQAINLKQDQHCYTCTEATICIIFLVSNMHMKYTFYTATSNFKKRFTWDIVTQTYRGYYTHKFFQYQTCIKKFYFIYLLYKICFCSTLYSCSFFFTLTLLLVVLQLSIAIVSFEVLNLHQTSFNSILSCITNIMNISCLSTESVYFEYNDYYEWYIVPNGT